MTAGLKAQLSASFESIGGRTLARVSSQPPLDLRGPLRASMGHDLYYLRNSTAGVFGGDRYEIDVSAQSGARVQIASASAAKVYAMREAASSRARLESGDGSCILWGPHATILQQGGDYLQETTAVLNGGSIFLAEVLVFGRLRRAECHQFRRFGSWLKVVAASGCPLYEERYELRGEDQQALHDALGGHGALASFYAFGADVLDAIGNRLACRSGVLDAVSVLPYDCGFVTRALADSLSEALAFLAKAEAIFCAGEHVTWFD